MILRPLVKIKVMGKVLKVGDKEFPIEVRSEYTSEDHEHTDRQRCFGPDGLETDSFIDMLGRLTGLQNPSVLLSCGPESLADGHVSRRYPLTSTYEHTLHSCNYYFRDESRRNRSGRILIAANGRSSLSSTSPTLPT